MATTLQIYIQEAFQFLQTCTIKFSLIADQMNAVLQSQGVPVDLTNPASFKYFLNLSGHYHPADTVMQVLSLDTQTLIEFTPANLASNPKTQAAYVVGSSYYNALCALYPQQADLVKSIVYPVDLATAINAPEFTLLGFGIGFLEATEQEAILTELTNFIAYVVNRWYFSFLNYEIYYPWAFWAGLWQSLPNAIFAARLKYLHTSYVHSFHIWSYLASNGIADYSDILTAQQALWLYRNINYLKANQGKQSNLVVLVNNLLSSLNVGLVGKTIFMDTGTTDAMLCRWTPEFVSTAVPTNNSQSLELIAPETFAEINTELVNAGFEVNSSIAWVDQEQTVLGNTILNILPTKLVEIQQLGIDKKYGGVMNLFVLDTLVSMISTQRYTAKIEFTDPTTKLSFVLTSGDALLLYYYAIWREARQPASAIPIPILYAPSCAFNYGLTAASFPSSFLFNGQRYPTRSMLSIDAMLSGLTLLPDSQHPISDPQQFGSVVANLFTVLVRYIRHSRLEADFIKATMFRHFCDTVALQKTSYTVDLTALPNYPAWLSNTKLTALAALLDAQANPSAAWGGLANAVMAALMPLDDPIFVFYGYTPSSVNDLYDRLKGLFVQLCSYNIAFLDTDRSNVLWILSSPLQIYMDTITDTTGLGIGLVSSDVVAPMAVVDSQQLSLALIDCETSLVADGVIPFHTEVDATISLIQSSTITIANHADGLSMQISGPMVTTTMVNHTDLKTAFFTDTAMGVT